MSESAQIGLVRDAWAALVDGDAVALKQSLAPDAAWRAVESGPFDCENRRAILGLIERHLNDGLRGTIEHLTQQGDRVIVAFRPEHPRDDGRPLDKGIAYVVVTVRDGLIVELKGCADAREAESYAGPPRR